MEKRGDYTVIAGCGRLGAAVAGMLSEERKNVLVLDQDKAAFHRLPGSYGGLTLTGGATDLERLNEAGMARASLFLAVTDRDCVNLCAAQIARTLFGVPRVVARIADPDKIPLLAGQGIESLCLPELAEQTLAGMIAKGGNKLC